MVIVRGIYTNGQNRNCSFVITATSHMKGTLQIHMQDVCSEFQNIYSTEQAINLTLSFPQSSFLSEAIFHLCLVWTNELICGSGRIGSA